MVGARRRTDRWPLVFGPVVGVAVSVLWNASAGDVWKTDAGYFFIKVDDVTQKHELLHRPWDFGADLVRTGYHQLWHWVHQPFTVGPSVTAGPAILAVLCVAIYAVSSLQRARAEAPAPLGWLQRALILLAFLVGVVLIGAANYIYWTPPGISTVEGIQPRYFMPLLVLAPGGGRVAAVEVGRHRSVARADPRAAGADARGVLRHRHVPHVLMMLA